METVSSDNRLKAEYRIHLRIKYRDMDTMRVQYAISVAIFNMT